MNQQINLYQPIFRRERKHLSFDALLKFSGILMVVIFLLSAAGSWRLVQLKHELNYTKQQHMQRLNQLTRLKEEAGKLQSGSQSDKELQRLQSELVAERYILSLLKQGKLTQSQGFSKYFESMSRRIIKGTWITGFEISNGGTDLRINGGALSAKLIPKFMQGLSQEALFVGKEFSVLEIERTKRNRNWIEFTLSADDQKY